MGATAAQALLGRGFSVIRHRGEKIESSLAPNVMATVHPSSILRAPDADSRKIQMKEFVRDLSAVADMSNLKSSGRSKEEIQRPAHDEPETVKAESSSAA
jgi:hypothetical protein